MGASIPPLRDPTRHKTARKRKSGRSGPFGSAQGRRDDSFGRGAGIWGTIGAGICVCGEGKREREESVRRRSVRAHRSLRDAKVGARSSSRVKWGWERNPRPTRRGGVWGTRQGFVITRGER